MKLYIHNEASADLMTAMTVCISTRVVEGQYIRINQGWFAMWSDIEAAFRIHPEADYMRVGVVHITRIG